MTDDICPVAGRFELGYMDWHYDAERRHKRGERQRYCGVCKRWVWPDRGTACPLARTVSTAEFKRLERLAGRGRR
jgi:hypothetical protein